MPPQPVSQYPKLHLDRFIRFSTADGCDNRQIHRPRYIGNSRPRLNPCIALRPKSGTGSGWWWCCDKRPQRLDVGMGLSLPAEPEKIHLLLRGTPPTDNNSEFLMVCLGSFLIINQSCIFRVVHVIKSLQDPLDILSGNNLEFEFPAVKSQ